jgi:antitoxin CptB
VAARLTAFSEAELAALEEILEMPDVELADFLTGRQPIPPESDSSMLRRMRDAAGEHLGR